MTTERIPAKFSYPEKYVDIDGVKMHYIESGEGMPILFLHGIPSSSYLWRNVIPHISKLGRCIALDLIGFGKSDKPDISYSVTDHIKYVEKFIEKLGLKSIVLVMHGFGSVIGFDYAMRHEKNCSGLVFYEAFLNSGSDDDISLPVQEQVLHWRNKFMQSSNAIDIVDELLAQSLMRPLTTEERNHYEQPFKESASIKALLTYLQELPVGTEKTPMDKIIKEYSHKLTQSTLPKLMMYSIPGFITTISTLMWAKETLPNIEIIDLGEELHLAQETSPELMGESVSIWLQGIEQGV